MSDSPAVVVLGTGSHSDYELLIDACPFPVASDPRKLSKNALHTSGSAVSCCSWAIVVVASLAEVTLFGLKECGQRKPTLEDMLSGH